MNTDALTVDHVVVGSTPWPIRPAPQLLTGHRSAPTPMSEESR